MHGALVAHIGTEPLPMAEPAVPSSRAAAGPAHNAGDCQDRDRDPRVAAVSPPLVLSHWPSREPPGARGAVPTVCWQQGDGDIHVAPAVARGKWHLHVQQCQTG